VMRLNLARARTTAARFWAHEPPVADSTVDGLIGGKFFSGRLG
jgi:hypothetical protein